MNFFKSLSVKEFMEPIRSKSGEGGDDAQNAKTKTIEAFCWQLVLKISQIEEKMNVEFPIKTIIEVKKLWSNEIFNA